MPGNCCGIDSAQLVQGARKCIYTLTGRVVWESESASLTLQQQQQLEPSQNIYSKNSATSQSWIRPRIGLKAFSRITESTSLQPSRTWDLSYSVSHHHSGPILTADAHTQAGYDVGVMGGLLPFQSFKEDFGLPTESSGFADGKVAEVSSNVVSLLTAGCCVGALSAAYANDVYGRRYSLMAYSAIFLLGAALQTGTPKDLHYIYAGRVIAGLGVGGMSSITPVFVAETAPADVRGRVTGLFQEFLVLGSTIAYWLNYGIARGMPVSSAQWRIPLGVQMIPAVILVIGLIFLKESPRWLVEKGKDAQALDSLAYIRKMPVDSHEVSREFAEIKTSLQEVEGKMRGATWRECLKPGIRNRFALIFAFMVCQQLTGTNSM